MKLIFQLGTNNWQTDEEPAPGSGILHQSQHNILNSLDDVKCFSIFPSSKQSSTSEDYRVFKLNHPIPICESSSPVSTYRWHSMSNEEFDAYKTRLENEVYSFMEDVEKKHGQSFDLAIAHHCFLNPLVMRKVMDRRAAAGKARVKIACFVHGTALRMFQNELEGNNQVEFPLRFHKIMMDEKVFTDLEHGVNTVIVNSTAVPARFDTVFPNFPKSRVYVSTPGVDDKVFYRRKDAIYKHVLESMGKPIWPKPAEKVDTDTFKRAIVFVGKLTEQKRIDSLLLAVQKYEADFPDVCTLIIGGGPDSYIEELTSIASKLNVKSVYFLGPRSQDVLAQVFSVASLGVFPSFEEAFGMVFIEAMVCGCPVIGCRSGGPISFITPEVGELVDDPGLEAVKEVGESLKEAIPRALQEDWKGTKLEACIELVQNNFSAKALTIQMLSDVMKIVETSI